MEFIARLLWPSTAVVIIYFLYTVFSAVRDIYFHPLSHIPGSRLWIAFPLLKFLSAAAGRKDEKIRSFHEQYGPCIRVGPDEVTFTDSDAWNDIYAHRHNFNMPKTGRREPGRPDSLISATPEAHARIRKLVVYGFSDQALREQESLIQGYIDTLMVALRTKAEKGQILDACDYMNFATFDIIGDLSFGQSFGGLRNLELHTWIANIFDMLKTIPVMREGARYPVLMFFAKKILATRMKRMLQCREYLWSFAADCVSRRIQDKTKQGRSDLIGAMYRHKGTPDEIPEGEIVSNVQIFIMAGSETTATLLSGLIYWLLRTPRALQRATTEVRNAFENPDISIATSSDPRLLPYTLACIEEALRIYPPAPTCFDRMTTLPTTIAGVDIPAGTKVGVHHSAAYWSANNFARAREFWPERFLKESREDPRSEFYNDKRDVFHPFSYGPRNCIGQNLAYAEIRLIIMKILWTFDMQFAEQMDVLGWERQKSSTVWQKKPLWLKFRVRDGA